MAKKPKFNIGDEVSVSFIGEIKGIQVNIVNNELEYKVVSKKTINLAYVPEVSVSALPTPQNNPKIKCLICKEIFPDALSFRDHIFNDKSDKHDVEWDTHTRVCPFCGGIINTRGIPPDGWETTCMYCDFLFDED
jgi:hypothetical protein